MRKVSLLLTASRSRMPAVVPMKSNEVSCHGENGSAAMAWQPLLDVVQQPDALGREGIVVADQVEAA